jgi:hypothetical protein
VIDDRVRQSWDFVVTFDFGPSEAASSSCWWICVVRLWWSELREADGLRRRRLTYHRSGPWGFA